MAFSAFTSGRALKQPVPPAKADHRASVVARRPPAQQRKVSPGSLAEWSDAVGQTSIDVASTADVLIRRSAAALAAGPHVDTERVSQLVGHVQHALNGSSSLFQSSAHFEPSATAQVYASMAEPSALHHAASAFDGDALQGLAHSTLTALADVGTAPGAALAADAASHMVNDAAQASVLALATWAMERLNGAADIDPAAAASMQATVQELVDALRGALDTQAGTSAVGWTNALVLGVQQLVTTVRMAGSSGGSNIESIVAAQQAMEQTLQTSSTGQMGSLGPVQIALGVLAVVVASIPRPGSSNNAGAADAGGNLPLRYITKDLDAYFAKRPAQVLQRNAKVVSSLGGWAVRFLVDWRLCRLNMQYQATSFCAIVEDLGPAYIKIAQQISTRVDLVPEVFLEEFKRLQDNVRTFSTVEAREVLEEGLGRPVDQVFEWLSAEPLAAASLGQVYRGKLRPEVGGGAEVAVKVQRPAVLETVALDIFIMRRAAVLVSKVPGMSDQWATVLDDWATRFFEEMDYQLEAYNTMTFKKQMASLKGIRVATVYPELTSRKIIISEWIEGEKLNNSKTEDIRALCSTLLNCYLIQLLETGLLHADPHPGNLLRTADGTIVILDFGLMTEVTEDQRVALVEFIAHLTMEDWSAVSQDLVSLGFMPDGMPPDAEAFIAPIMEQVMGQLMKGGGLRNFNIGNLTSDLQGAAMNYKLCLPPYFALVLRAFCVIEGIALKTDENYAIVHECLPYLSRRLLTDNNPRMRVALRQLLYGHGNRLDVARLSKMVASFGAFTTGPRQAAGPTFSSAAERAYAERVKGVQPDNLLLGSGDDGPVVNEATKEVLKVVFSKDGTYAQELIVEELVAAVDAMSREAMGEALRMVMSSAGAVRALRSVEALGPLRSMLMPLPLPMEMLSSMAPAVALTAEDRQALAMVHTILELLQPSLTRIPDMAANGSRAIRAASELMPIFPELLPGMRATLELFMRQLVRRMALRLAEDLAAAPQPAPAPQAVPAAAAAAPPPPPYRGASADAFGKRK